MTRHNTSRSIYQPLDGEWDIRLLKILPRNAADDSVVHCKLIICSLEDEITYSALSYVWGDPNTTRPVIVDGCEVQATTNLADALFQLQSNGEDTLWVDALCINQDDNIEKGHQVQIMDTIFREARTVIAWLGPASSESTRAVEAMSILANVATLAGLGNVLSPRVGDVPKNQKGKVLDDICSPLLGGSFDLSDGDIGRVIALLDGPYWRRLWILQEISLARSATLVCGADSVAWEKAERALAIIKWLRHAAAQVPHRFEELSQRLYALYRPYVLEDWRPPPAAALSAHASKQTRLSLFDILDLTACGTELECSFPKDRVYGLLGLLDDAYPFPRTVDYSAPYVDLYVQATISMLSCHGPIALVFGGLAFQKAHDESAERTLPSWVVDWRCTQKRAQRMWEFVPDPLQEFVFRMSDDGFEITVRVASAAEVFAIIPYSLDFRCIFQQFKELREQLFPRREWKNHPMRNLETMLWHAILYTSKVTPCEENEVSDLFNACIHSVPSAEHDPSLTHNDSQAGTQDPAPLGTRARTFESLLWNQTPRVLFLTTSGVIGSGPICTRTGDMVYAIPGLELPLLLRRDEPRHGFELVGAAFVDDMMEIGESGFWTLDRFWAAEREVREVVLV